MPTSGRHRAVLRKMFPAHLVNRWIGHTQQVAEDHYIQELSSDFIDAYNAEKTVPEHAGIGCFGVEAEKVGEATSPCISTAFNTTPKSLQGNNLSPLAEAGLCGNISILLPFLVLRLPPFYVPTLIPTSGESKFSFDGSLSHTEGNIFPSSVTIIPPYTIEVDRPGNCPVASDTDDILTSNNERIQS